MITPYRTIPRSVRELILRDLARQTRTPKAIADRHHVPVEAVTALRDHCGPGPVELLAHARQLLSSQDLRTCRAWALLTGRSSSRGPMARDVVTEWLRLGRPEAPTPVEAPSEPVEEEGAATPSAREAPAVLAVAEAPAIAASVGSDMPVNNIHAEVTPDRPVVGLDPSLTGLGLATPDTLTTISSKPTGDTVAARAERLVTMADKVARLIPESSLVVIEGPAYSRQLGAGHHLSAGLWWVLAVELTHRGHDVIEVSPSALKKFATGKGNATKADLRMALFQRAGLDVRDDDQVDAYFLRQVGLHLVGDPDALPLPKTHLAVLAGVQYAAG